MLQLIRNQQRWIMIVVASIVIVAFAWFFNPYDRRGGPLGQDLVFRIGGKGVSVKEVHRQKRIFGAARALRLWFVYQLVPPTATRNEDAMVVGFAQNRMLLNMEARKLGIDPSEEDVQLAITKHPLFQRDGAFSEDTYLDALQNVVKPNGLVAEDLRGLVADEIRMERVRELLSTGFEVPQSVVDVEFHRERELITASVVDFKREDFEEGIEPTDEELQEFYDGQLELLPSIERQARGRLEADEEAAMKLLTAPERRRVEFVFIEAPKPPPPPTAPKPPVIHKPPPLLRPDAGVPRIGLPGENVAPLPQEIEPLQVQPPGGPADESEPPGQAPPAEAPPEEAPPEEAPPAEAPPAEAPPEEAPPEEAPPEEAPPAEAPPAEAPPEGAPPEGAEPLEVEPLPLPPVDPDGGPDPAPAEDPAAEDPGAPGGPKQQLNGDLVADEEPVEPEKATAPAVDHETAMKAYQMRADELYDNVLADPEHFKSIVESEGLELKTTELFSKDEPPASPVVPAKLVTALFDGSLEIDQGILAPVEALAPEGFYLARLLEVDESYEYSLEEVKEEVREALIQRRSSEKMKEAASEARDKLLAALEEGKAIADVAKELELSLREIPEFTLDQPPRSADKVAAILEAVQKTTTGTVGEVTDAGEDALLACVSQRVRASEAEPKPGQPGPPGSETSPAEEKAALADELKMNARSRLLALWMIDRRKEADIDPPL